LTAQGRVEEIRVVSGHPLLVQAAVDCVKQWQYEPTYLNGIAVPIILTAKVHFMRAPVS
jgi:protein TonB